MTEPQWWSDFQRARPQSRATQDWVNTARGREVLSEIQRAAATAPPTRKLPPRRWGLGVLVAAVVAGGGGAAYALTNQTRVPLSTATVACLQTESLTANSAITSTKGPTPAAAIAACSGQWSQLWPLTPKPLNFAVCVYPQSKGQSGGDLLVTPASQGEENDTACRAIGADVIAR